MSAAEKKTPILYVHKN